MSCPKAISKGKLFFNVRRFFYSTPDVVKLPRSTAQKGQALIVILLVSAIGLTIGLTLASRSTEETSITTELEESSRAFSAAEAGLEESIQSIGVYPTGAIVGSLGSGANYTVDIEVAAGEAGPFQFPGEIKNNQPVTVWLVEHNNDGTIDWSNSQGKNYPETENTIEICWGESGGAEAALMVSLYHYPDGEIRRQAYDPSGNATIINNAVAASNASPDDCGGNYSYKASPVFTDAGMPGFGDPPGDTRAFLRIRPVVDGGGETRLAIAPAGAPAGWAVLPSQGEIHTSTGTTASGQQTKIVQFISHPGPPELFDTVIYSDKALTK